MAKTVEKVIEKKEVIKPTLPTAKKEKEGVSVSVTSNGGIGFLVTEKGVDGSISQYLSETDPTAENQ